MSGVMAVAQCQRANWAVRERTGLSQPHYTLFLLMRLETHNSGDTGKTAEWGGGVDP